MLQLEAAACRLPAISAFGGLSAAWLHGIDVDGCNPIEVIVPKGNKVSGRSGMKVYRARLPEDEVAVAHGLRATNILRTLEDIGRRSSLVEGTVVVDAALADQLCALLYPEVGVRDPGSFHPTPDLIAAYTAAVTAASAVGLTREQATMLIELAGQL